MSTHRSNALRDPNELRKSPIILWGLGKTAQRLARQVADTAARASIAGEALHLFDEGVDSGSALKELVTTVAQRGRSRDIRAEVEIQLLASTWEAASVLSEVLANVAKILDAAAPGNQLITLALLVPPSIASAEDLGRARNALRTVAGRMGDLRFLGSAFVIQVPSNIYRDLDSSDADLADLREILICTTIDAESTKAIHRLGDPLIRNRRHIGGEPAGFSSLSVQRVTYAQAELLRYLQARFQYELFLFGFYDPDGLSREQYDALQVRSRDLTKKVFEAFSKRLDELAKSRVLGNRPDSDAREEAQLRADLERGIEEGEIRTATEVAELLDRLDAGLRQDFDDLLESPPAFLLGPAVYLEILQGEEKQRQDQEELSDLYGLERAFRRLPIQNLAVSLFGPLFQEAMSRLDVEVSSDEASEADENEVREIEAGLLARMGESRGSGIGSPACFLADAWIAIQEALAAPSFRSDESRALFFHVADSCLSETEAITEILARFDGERDALREQMRELRRTYPFYKFWRLGPYFTGKRQLKEQLAGLAQEREEVLAAEAFTRRAFETVANELLWHHHVRVLMVDGFRARYERLRGDFEQYMETLWTAWSVEYRRAMQLNVVDRWTETSVNSVEKFEVAYERFLERPNWKRLSANALAFLPDRRAWKEEQAPRYAKCQNLRDHFHADVEFLFQRVAAFGDELLADARGLDVLDVVELEGGIPAQDFLSGVFSKMDALPEFGSGRIPALEEEGLFQRQRLICCTRGVGERLRSKYGYLLHHNDQVIDSEPPQLVEITGFTFGFPASLLHVLRSGQVNNDATGDG